MTPDRRMTITAAVACVLVSTALFPVFISSLWFVAATGAVIVAAATGALTRLRRLPVAACLAAGVAGLLLYLNLVFEGHHSLLLVIPTPGSLARLWDLAVTGLTDANKYVLPVPNVRGLLLLAVGGVGITAVMTDLIAVRLRSAALAGLPLLVLFSVPVMMNASHNQLANGVVFCLAGAGYLAMLNADGRERIRVWGRLISLWRTGPRYDGAGRGTGRGVRDLARGPDTRALAAAGRRVGLASIVLALCAPVFLPGLHASKLFSSGPGIGGDGSGAGSAALSLPGALSQAVTQLHEGHQATVFTYRTSASPAMQDNDAEYFRQYVFNALTGAGWVVSNYAAGATDISKLSAPQGLADTAPDPRVTTTVTVSAAFPSSGSAPVFLPLPYPAIRISAPGRWLADPDQMVYSTSDPIAGRTYSVTSLMVDPSQAQLQDAPVLTTTPSLAPDLLLPSSYQTQTLKRLAQASTSRQYTEFGKVYALANWLSGAQFGYSLNAPTFTDAAGLVTFLTRTKTGFCVQYAYAMTVLTRLLGIPARFVVGYTAGTRLSDGSYAVRNTDAHAWTEVYFPTIGWVRFEPTPAGQGTASAPNYMIPASSHAQSGQSAPILPAPKQSPTNPHDSTVGHSLQEGEAGLSPTVAAGRAGTPWTAVALAVIAAILLASGLIAIVMPEFSPAQRAHPGRAAGGRRRRGSALPAVAALTAAAALVALALYRLLSRTSGLDLRAGWATVGIAFGAVAVLVLTAPAALRLIRRRWRWMRADDDASRAHAAWRELHDDLADYGIATRPSEPPRTLAARITTGLPEPAAAAVIRLAMAEERACYAARPAESRYLRHDAATARRGLAANTGRGARWRAALFPASLLTTLASTAVRLPEHAAALRPGHRARDNAAN